MRFLANIWGGWEFLLGAPARKKGAIFVTYNNADTRRPFGRPMELRPMGTIWVPFCVFVYLSPHTHIINTESSYARQILSTKSMLFFHFFAIVLFSVAFRPLFRSLKCSQVTGQSAYHSCRWKTVNSQPKCPTRVTVNWLVLGKTARCLRPCMSLTRNLLSFFLQ